jgi:hypothetical protein
VVAAAVDVAATAVTAADAGSQLRTVYSDRKGRSSDVATALDLFEG